MFPLITAVVLAKNEEKHIAECVKSLTFCDEIIILDDYSADGTAELIQDLKSPKITVIPHSLDNDFSKTRNFGLSKAKGEWVLYADADERVSPALAFEISNTLRLKDQSFNGFYMRRRDLMWGKELKHGETGNIKLLRLGKRDKGKWEGKVHEQWKIKGKVGELKNPLLHFPHQTVDEFLQKINFYTSLRAQDLYKKGKKENAILIILYPLGKFLLNFFLKKGFMDGTRGFIFALMMSFHSFLVRSKLWLLWNKK